MYEALLNLLQTSILLSEADADLQVAKQNEVASSAMVGDIVNAIERRGAAGHIEFSQFSPEGR